MIILSTIGVVIFLSILYLVHVNNVYYRVPEEARKLSAPEWTEEEIRQAYEKVGEKPIDFTAHLPPRQDRRYVVVGGSGLVGGFIVLHLLARGQPPESIRIIDFRGPSRSDLKSGKAAKVDLVEADITSINSITAAFQKSWAPSVASLPLTVFHTAAAIRPGERARDLVHRVSKVNVTGTENVVSAAKRNGADIFIATSSGSVALRPVNFWIPPWKNAIDRVVQLFKDPLEDHNLRPHNDYFANYSMTKAQAEDIVLKAHSESFRTGAIRPVCAIYGNQYDLDFGYHMVRGSIESWFAHVTLNHVHGENISLAHLLYEHTLAHPPTSMPVSQIGGRSFNISDPNAPPTCASLYRVLTTLTDCKYVAVPFVPVLILAHIIEAYTLFVFRYPFFARTFGLREPTGEISILQPAMLKSAGVHQFGFSTQAEKRVEDGGLGYRGVCTTLEGMCAEVRTFKADGKRAEWTLERTFLGIPAKK
ncbi:MAG: hypothetical protein M1821_005521 [Bathelium mastoideum]|nr:MAG: hypothetical protein M1821_005521 [Bathelium mastoideum]KAI9691850.1 MAG: hypothetical protein M1822_007922 [Bathelium mastoideum]